MKTELLMDILNSVAPFKTAEEWDNSGLLIGSPDRDIHKIGIVLDITNDAVDFAAENGIDIIISHHPVIFHPISSTTHQRI